MICAYIIVVLKPETLRPLEILGIHRKIILRWILSSFP
jgi:hypothetical protein